MRKKSKLYLVIYTIGQLTWGILQTLVGFVIFLMNLRATHKYFNGAIMTTWKSKSSLSLGMLIFVTDDPFCHYPNKVGEFSKDEFATMFAVHEYGHTIQSLLFGPLYLIAVGAASMIWAKVPYFSRKRAKEQRSYFEVYPENEANKFGELVLGIKSPGAIKQ